MSAALAGEDLAIRFEASAAAVDGGSLVRAYESLVVIYLVTLLFLYPYGIPLGADASVKFPDLVGMMCLLLGFTVLALRPRVRPDLLFLAVVGPFVLLEIATPVIGAVGYRKPGDVVSSIRMAILWLPMILLTMIAPPAAQPRFERRLRLLLATTLWLNIPYSMVLIAVDLGFAPSWMAFTRFLEPWAVIAYFDVVEGLRPAGFFANTTALSVFAIVCLSFFYARYAAAQSRNDLYHALGALFLVLLTTSRVAFGAAGLIVMVGWTVLTGRRKLAIAAVFLAVAAALLVVIEETIGLERVFYRFIRVAESGLLADVSFGGRIMETWPAALAVAREYPFGTLISAPRVADLIDSGYLNYYIQGKWLFIAGVAVMLAGSLAIGLRCLRRSRSLTGGTMMLFLAIFLILAMIVSNPARSPAAIALLVFAYWKLRIERASRWVRITVPADRP